MLRSKYSLGSWYDDFLALRAAVVRAVAMVWAADHNAAATTDDGQRSGFKQAFLTDPTGKMASWFGYQYPFNTTLKVSFPSTSDCLGGRNDEFLPAHTGGWVGVNNTIELKLPPPPADKSLWAEALATYNQMRPFFLTYDPD